MDTSIQMSELYLGLKWLHKLWILIPKVWVCKVRILQKLAPQNTRGFGKHLGKGYGKGDMAVLGSTQHLPAQVASLAQKTTSVTGPQRGMQEKVPLLAQGSRVKHHCGAQSFLKNLSSLANC